MKRAFRVVALFLLIPASLWLVLRIAPRLHPGGDVPGGEQRELRGLGMQAISSLDVPVAALLLYDDSIIGRGYNTVLKDANAGGHAEINAISDAMHRFGEERFHALDHERLTMISTFEPCAMCKGAILEYRIGHVRYMRSKSLMHWLKNDARSALYEVTLTHVGPEGLQDSLFSAHPRYDRSKDDH